MQGPKSNFVSAKDSKYDYNWNFMPDSLLLCIFQYLSPRELLTAGLTCKTWLRISYDEILWKNLFRSHFNLAHSLDISPGKKSWLQEFKRLTYRLPSIQTEILINHNHQVLHVAFAHNGKFFATCSKDCFVLVWNSSYPATIKYEKDMREFHWNYTQFCQFNLSDTLLLVSGVHNSGEIAVFNLQGGLNLQCRIVNRPYNIFGSWYGDHYLLSGNHHWLTHLRSLSVIWLNKASQETSSEHVPIMSKLCNFCNYNAGSISSIMVANCLPSYELPCDNLFSTSKTLGNCKASIEIAPETHLKSNIFCQNYFNLNDSLKKQCKTFSQTLPVNFINSENFRFDLELATPILYNEEYRRTEMENHKNFLQNEHNDWSSEDESYSGIYIIYIVKTATFCRSIFYKIA